NPASGYRTLSRLVSLSVRFSIWTSTSVDLATFAHHLFRRLFGAHSLEGRGAQLAGLRPLDELDFGDELRLHEVGCFRRRADVEWALVLSQRLHRALQLIEHRICEAGPHLAGVDELVLGVVADEQSARIPRALA